MLAREAALRPLGGFPLSPIPIAPRHPARDYLLLMPFNFFIFNVEVLSYCKLYSPRQSQARVVFLLSHASSVCPVLSPE